jgi:copper resistance protein D
MAETWIAIRFVHFAAVMGAFGIGAFRLYAFAGVSGCAPTRAALDRALAQLARLYAVVALLSALAIIPFIAAEMAGSRGAALDPAIWRTVLVSTQFGHLWVWHLGFAFVLLMLYTAPTARQAWPATLAALLSLMSLGLIGHAAMDMGGGVGHKINEVVHLSAGGIWVGGLVPLGVLLWRAVRPGGDAYVALARCGLSHFSQMGYVAVALVAITGTVNSVMLVGSFHAFVTTPYGRLLTVKIVLFTGMIALASLNRFRLVPRLRRSDEVIVPLRILLRSVVIEQTLGLALLAAVAVLGTWAPAVDAMSM